MANAIKMTIAKNGAKMFYLDGKRISRDKAIEISENADNEMLTNALGANVELKDAQAILVIATKDPLEVGKYREFGWCFTNVIDAVEAAKKVAALFGDRFIKADVRGDATFDNRIIATVDKAGNVEVKKQTPEYIFTAYQTVTGVDCNGRTEHVESFATTCKELGDDDNFTGLYRAVTFYEDWHYNAWDIKTADGKLIAKGNTEAELKKAYEAIKAGNVEVSEEIAEINADEETADITDVETAEVIPVERFWCEVEIAGLSEQDAVDIVAHFHGQDGANKFFKMRATELDGTEEDIDGDNVFDYLPALDELNDVDWIDDPEDTPAEVSTDNVEETDEAEEYNFIVNINYTIDGDGVKIIKLERKEFTNAADAANHIITFAAEHTEFTFVKAEIKDWATGNEYTFSPADIADNERDAAMSEVYTTAEAIDAAAEAEIELANNNVEVSEQHADSELALVNKYLEACKEIFIKCNNAGQTIWYRAIPTKDSWTGEYIWLGAYADKKQRISKDKADALYLPRYGLTADEFLAAEKIYYTKYSNNAAYANYGKEPAAAEAEAELANNNVEETADNPEGYIFTAYMLITGVDSNGRTERVEPFTTNCKELGSENNFTGLFREVTFYNEDNKCGWDIKAADGTTLAKGTTKAELKAAFAKIDDDPEDTPPADIEEITVNNETATFINGQFRCVWSKTYDAGFDTHFSAYAAWVHFTDGSLCHLKLIHEEEEFFALMVERGACIIDPPVNPPDNDVTTAEQLTAQLKNVTRKAAYMNVYTQDGTNIISDFGNVEVFIDCGEGFIFTNGHDTLARYDTEEHCLNVIKQITTAIKFGDSGFTFPSVADLDLEEKVYAELRAFKIYRHPRRVPYRLKMTSRLQNGLRR